MLAEFSTQIRVQGTVVSCPVEPFSIWTTTCVEDTQTYRPQVLVFYSIVIRLATGLFEFQH